MKSHKIAIEVAEGAWADGADAMVAECARALHLASIPLQHIEYVGHASKRAVREVSTSDAVKVEDD